MLICEKYLHQKFKGYQKWKGRIDSFLSEMKSKKIIPSLYLQNISGYQKNGCAALKCWDATTNGFILNYISIIIVTSKKTKKK